MYLGFEIRIGKSGIEKDVFAIGALDQPKHEGNVYAIV
jgi:hypothetical protein